jgi:hypothetical protein
MGTEADAQPGTGEILTCRQGGKATCRVLPSAISASVTGIVPIPSGGVIVSGAGRPYLARLNRDRAERDVVLGTGMGKGETASC